MCLYYFHESALINICWTVCLFPVHFVIQLHDLYSIHKGKCISDPFFIRGQIITTDIIADKDLYGACQNDNLHLPWPSLILEYEFLMDPVLNYYILSIT